MNLQLPISLENNNLLAWVSANGSVFLTSYLTDKPIALSWKKLKIVAPELARSLKNAGLTGERIPEHWRNNSNLLDARGAGVYDKNIPKAISRLGVDAITQFKQGKHWSHQLSYKQGIEQGFSKIDLADPANGIFEKAADNMRRGAKNMPEGWGDDLNPGKLQVYFFNELESLEIVCKYAVVNAYHEFTVGAVYELVFASLENGLALQRQDISLEEAIQNISSRSLQMGVKNAISAAMIAGICAYLPGAGIILSTAAPILVGMTSVSMLLRVYDTISIHIQSQNLITPSQFDLSAIEEYINLKEIEVKKIEAELNNLIVSQDNNRSIQLNIQLSQTKQEIACLQNRIVQVKYRQIHQAINQKANNFEQIIQHCEQIADIKFNLCNNPTFLRELTELLDLDNQLTEQELYFSIVGQANFAHWQQQFNALKIDDLVSVVVPKSMIDLSQELNEIKSGIQQLTKTSNFLKKLNTNIKAELGFFWKKDLNQFIDNLQVIVLECKILEWASFEKITVQIAKLEQCLQKIIHNLQKGITINLLKNKIKESESYMSLTEPIIILGFQYDFIELEIENLNLFLIEEYSTTITNIEQRLVDIQSQFLSFIIVSERLYQFYTILNTELNYLERSLLNLNYCIRNITKSLEILEKKYNYKSQINIDDTVINTINQDVKLWQRLGKFIKLDFSKITNYQSEYIENYFNSIILEMQQEITTISDFLAVIIESQNQAQVECQKNECEAYLWQNRAKKFLAQGNDNWAREALIQKQFYMKKIHDIKQLITEQNKYINSSNCGILILKHKIEEIEMIKDLFQLKANLEQAKTQQNEILNRLSILFSKS